MCTDRKGRVLVGTLALAGLVALSAHGQALDEDFETVTATGGGLFFAGQGEGLNFDWDTGLLGENAFAGAAGNARHSGASAFGSATAGVGGGGGGVIDVAPINFNLLDEDFNAVAGTGGGVFLAGDGTPDTFNFTLNWDDGLSGDVAFGGTFGGAILDGDMAAQGLPTGGADGFGGGQLVVTNVDTTTGSWFAGLQWDIGPLPGAAPVLNPGFESAGGSLDEWTEFGAGFNVLAETATAGPPLIEPRSGNALCKMFGQFTGAFNASGIFQSFAAEPGQTWEIDVFSRYNSDDSIAGTQNHMVMKIEFLDAGGTVLMEDEVRILDANSPADGWIDHTPLPLGPAPAGTVEARPVFLFIQPAAGLFEGGAGHLDDASFRLVGGGGGAIDLGAFSLTADVRGAANAGAGETLGDYQLRLEDSGGNRLIFAETANGAFQSIGGPLSTAQETDPDGNPAVDVFDVNSSAFHVVLAFDNESGMPWGAGGTIEVDNLTLANTDPDGSAWFAGLFWNGLVLPEGGAFDTLSLTADVKGSVPGGAYELRVEAFEVTFAGLDHNFDAVTGVGGGVFLDPNGGGFGFTTDWDAGVQGEGAFGGLFGGSTIFPFSSTSGFSAQGLVGGGLSGGAGEIRVEDVILGVGGGWFAGLDFGDQGLASTDLSQVTLSANVRGLTASGGNLGDYELRIEDAQGDRLYFPMTANGAWQAVGGTLNTALEGGALGGGGDGFFDLDSPTYTVVLSFVGPETTWLFGGALQIDDLFLTPVQVNNEIGRVSFQGIANGAFQTLGGLLADGVSNFGDYDQDFSGASATGGGAYGPGNAGGWDDGLSNEDAFFGVFGNAVINAGASAQACATCGVGGSRAGQLIVDDVPPGTGGWFAGLFFTDVAADLSGDLSQLMLSADVQGATVGAGSTLGNYFIRIEDADLTVLSFTVAANGAFQSVGGALTDATLEQIDAGDGVFNFNQPAYTVAIGFVGTSSNWGPGGALTVDNLFLSGVQFEDADTYTVTVTFADEVATWGTNGTLTVDNLFLGVAPDCPGDLTGDSVIGLSDLAILLSNFGTVSGAAPGDGDLDDDGDVDITDLAIMLSLFGTSCA